VVTGGKGGKAEGMVLIAMSCVIGGRMNEECGFALNANSTGKNGVTPLGDLMTIICSYDTTKGPSPLLSSPLLSSPLLSSSSLLLIVCVTGYASNSLAEWYATVGTQKRMNGLLSKWLYKDRYSTFLWAAISDLMVMSCSSPRPQETFAGTYGMPPPPDLSYSFSDRSKSIKNHQCNVTPSLTFDPNLNNQISTFTASELTRYIPADLLDSHWR